MAIAGWYQDPTGHGDGRYWDGQRWGDQINRNGVTVTSPIDPAVAQTPPAPGTEYVATPATATPASQAPPASSGGNALGPVLAGVALVIAIIALVLVISGDDDSDKDEEPTTTTIEAPPAEDDGAESE
jgi:hypothetical protein